MSDFFQNGVITTLHQLRQRPIDEIESELLRFSQTRPLSLVLPCLIDELSRPALQTIVSEIAKVPYLSQIVVGLDGADEAEYRAARQFFAQLPQNTRVIWNDGPRLQALDERLRSELLAPEARGKGCNVWYSLGYILTHGETYTGAVALHDCDILGYDRNMLARLLYPVANNNFSYEFCKGYYARVGQERLNGRVCRLLLTPLIRTLRKIFGPLEYLDYLDSFRYALAGEFSLRTGVVSDLRIPTDWCLEIGVLSEMYRNYSTNRLCQIDIADQYDHKHKALSAHDDSGGLAKMSIDIIKAIYRKLATNGVVFTTESFRSIKATYYRVALDFVSTYAADARVNGLSFDNHREEQAVELFAKNIVKAGEIFLKNPMETPFIPSWSRVRSAMPDVLDQLSDAIEADHRDYG